jgi:hypothetical protein
MGEVTVKWEKSFNDFDISKYTPFTFHVSKKRCDSIYYKCKRKAGMLCQSTAIAKFSDGNATIKFLGEHNHPAEERKKIYKETANRVKQLIADTPTITPTEVLSKITEHLSNEEIRDLSNVPTRRQISDFKYCLVHSNFPDRDHLWNSILQHGQFDGSTRFIKFFSLIPLFIILSTEEGSIRCQASNFFLVDTTFSTTSPSLYLTTLYSVTKEQGLFHCCLTK